MNLTTIDTALKQLTVLSGQNQGMADACSFYQRLLPVLKEASASIPPLSRNSTFSLDRASLNQKLAAGVPLLVGEILELEPGKSDALFLAICQAIETKSAGPAVRRIWWGVEAGNLDVSRLLSAVECGNDKVVMQVAQQFDIDDRLVRLLAQNTIKAFLRAWREELEASVDLDHWKRNLCPFCGSLPGLAEIQGVESVRHLRCLRCGANWPYPNLMCAFCGNEDHRSLGIIHLEGEAGKNYLHVCELCKHYLKTITTFEPTPADLLVIEDLQTLYLDQVATCSGYRMVGRS